MSKRIDLIHYRYEGNNALGVVRDTYVINLTKAYRLQLAAEGRANAESVANALLGPDPLAFFKDYDLSVAELASVLNFVEKQSEAVLVHEGVLVDREKVETLVPIPNPPKIVCVARNFGEHAKEAGLPVSEIPILFARFANTQIADGAEIMVPSVSEQVDWEGELAVIISHGGYRISKKDAMKHVGGYTIFNDVSVRDYQFRVAQYTGGKNFRTSGPIGPVIVLPHKGFDPHDAEITTTVNGEVMQSGNTRDFIFDIPTIIEHISEFIPLEPGDIIPMGTPAGVGFKRTPPIFLRDGDVVEVSVAGIGVLSNPVINERL